MNCPRCQQGNPSYAMFCLACGAPGNEAPAQARRYAELKGEIESLGRSLSVALEQQTATSEILGVISRSQTDPKSIFDAIVRSASRLGGGEYAIVTRYDGELLHLAAQHRSSRCS